LATLFPPSVVVPPQSNPHEVRGITEKRVPKREKCRFAIPNLARIGPTNDYSSLLLKARVQEHWCDRSCLRLTFAFKNKWSPFAFSTSAKRQAVTVIQ